MNNSIRELLVLANAIEGGKPPFEEIAHLALDHFDDVISILGLEDGEYRNKQFVAFNPHRVDNNLGSFSINSETGVFKDFAVDDCGGSDLIALAAYRWQCSNTDAAFRLLKELAAIEQGDTVSALSSSVACPSKKSGRKKDIDEDPAVTPVPADAPEIFVRSFLPKNGKLSARYDYRDIDGSLHSSILRILPENGGKYFTPVSLRRATDGALYWTAKMVPGRRLLFNLPQLALHPDVLVPVFIVEGEKAAQAAYTALGEVYPVLTSSGGSNNADNADWSPLAGRKTIIIWPDNDKPGAHYKDTVAAQLRQVDTGIKILVVDLDRFFSALCHLQGWNYDEKKAEFEKWDAADVLALGLEPEKINDLLFETLEEIGGALMMEAEPRFEYCETQNGYNYRISDALGVQVEMTTEDGKTFWKPVCSPLYIIGLCRDSDSTAWSMLLRLKTPDGNWHEITVLRSRLAEFQPVKAELLDKGLTIHNGADLQAYLSGVLPDARYLLARQAGWTGNVYVRPTQVIGQSDEPIMFLPEGGKQIEYSQQGTVEEWQQNIGRYCPRNSRLAFGICLGLVGPILHLLRQENGGVHYVGPSSTGKTTILRCIASLFGLPHQLITSWRATSNGLEGVATSHNDMALLIDEMGQASGLEVGETVYMLGNGVGKIRSRASGLNASVKRWRLQICSTGEIPLGEHMRSAGKTVRAGMEIRLLDLPADCGKGFGIYEDLYDKHNSLALADHLNDAASKYYGVVGHSWIEYLVQKVQASTMEKFSEECQCRLDATARRICSDQSLGQVNRAAKRFATFALAGEMATEAGLLGWEPGDAERAAKACFEAWLENRGGSGSGETLAAFRQVQLFFERYGQSRFQRTGNYGGYSSGTGSDSLDTDRMIHDRAGYARYEADGTYEFLVLPSVFNATVCLGLDRNVVLKVLDERGLLLRGTDGAPTTTVRIAGQGSPQRVYRIKGSIVGEVQPTSSPGERGTEPEVITA